MRIPTERCVRRNDASEERGRRRNHDNVVWPCVLWLEGFAIFPQKVPASKKAVTEKTASLQLLRKQFTALPRPATGAPVLPSLPPQPHSESGDGS
jgi:hypothetical protein